MRKNKVGRVQSDVQMNKVDLREAPSSSVRHSMTSLNLQPRMPERRDARDLVPERKGASIPGQIPYMRSADALPRVDSLRNSYSPWTLDRIRKRSPDVVLRSSRNLLPRRNDVDITRGPLMRAYDDARTESYMSRDILDRGRDFGTPSYMKKPPIASAPLKSYASSQALPSQPSGIVHRSSYMVQIFPFFGNRMVQITNLDCIFLSSFFPEIQCRSCTLVRTSYDPLQPFK